jgi:hypothetical protein
MARAALGAPTADNGSFVRMSDAMYELLEADGAGELKPPLSELLRENMGAYIDHWVGPAADRDMVPHAGIGALLLAQAITHGS